MKKRALVVLSAVGILIVLAFLMNERGAPVDTTLVGDGARIVRIVRDGEPTTSAYASVPFTRRSDDLSFANVAIDLNGDGKIAEYAVGEGGMQEEWVVRNSFAKVIEGGNGFSFDLVDRGADAKADLRLTVMLTAMPVEEWSGKPRKGSAALDRVIPAIEVEDFGPLFTVTDPDGTGAGSGDAVPASDKDLSAKVPRDAVPWIKDTTVDEDGTGAGQAAAIGATAPSGAPPAGFDFEVFQSDVPDMSQGVNECVPTSTSNSLQWLGRRYGFEDKLPPSQREIMEELKRDFRWTSADGVYVEPNFIPGKVAFTQRHGLPIVTHQIGGKFDPNMAQNIAAELAKGQAVEVVIGYYRLNAANEWVRNGGHMMSAVGAFGANGRSYLGLHDPLSPEAGRLDIYNVDGSRMFDYRYRGNSSVFIEYAIAQSPTQAWVTAHPPATAIETAGGMIEASALQDVWTVDMLRIGTSWFPAVQFHKFTGPECDRQEHWHANKRVAWGLDLRNSDYFDLNPQRVRSRNAPVVSWNDPDGCGAGKTSEVERRNIMVGGDEAFALAGRIVE